MRAEVIAIGDELVSGQRLDTNSRWLSAELTLLGIPTAFHVTAADTIEAGIDAFRTAIRRADVVVATGGLGPTADDLTRDVLAAVVDAPLESSAEALAAVEARFARRGTPMPESNRRQALFPRGSRIIPNPDGTAPGIDLAVTSSGRPVRVFALPGVPSEMRGMWQATVAPALLGMQPEAATIVQRRVKCFGAGESAVEAMLPDLIRRGRDPLVGITVHEATITLRIAARGHDEAACRARIEPVEATIRAALGPLVFGAEDDEVEDAAIRALAASGRTIGTAEIGTEGRVATLLGQAQGRVGAAEPARFRGGLVLPATAVGEVVELAETARRHFDASLGLAVGRVGRGADGRDVVGIVVTTGRHVEQREHILGGGPALALARAAKTAVDLVRRGEGPASHG